MKIENWFIATVTNTGDPYQSGRVQIRAFGYHDFDVIHLPDKDLPWAMPLMPVTSANANGTGETPVGLLVGSWVFGFFRDPDAQDPVILGVVPGVNGITNVVPADATSSSVGISAISSANTADYVTAAPIAGAANTTSFGNNPVEFDPSINSAIARGIIATAKSQVGNTDRRVYGVSGNTPWCAAFITWNVKKTGLVPNSDLPDAPLSSMAWKRWGQSATGQKYVSFQTNPRQFKVGDLVIRHRGGPNSGLGHIGMVSKVSDTFDLLETIEGNSGGRVREGKSRAASWSYALSWKDTGASQSSSTLSNVNQLLSPTVFNV